MLDWFVVEDVVEEITIDSVFEVDMVEMGCETTYSSDTMKQLVFCINY